MVRSSSICGTVDAGGWRHQLVDRGVQLLFLKVDSFSGVEMSLGRTGPESRAKFGYGRAKISSREINSQSIPEHEGFQ